jgi:Glycosyl transferase family 2
MATSDAPRDVIELAEARAAARRARAWDEADALKARIEEAGWRVVDAGSLYSLERASEPDVEVGGTVRHGSSLSVPSRLDEAPVGIATVVLVATDWPEDLARALRGLVEHAPDGTQLVVVANAPSAAQAQALEGLDAADPGAPGIVTEVVWTATRLGHAAALNAGLRRAAAPVVIVLDTSVEPVGDVVGPLAAALEDQSVAVAGPFGLVTRDLRTFAPAGEGTADVAAVEGYLMAFRRVDVVARGPLDEHFSFYRNLDVWWSLALRDQYADLPELGDDDEVDLAAIPAPRRAVQVASLPVVRHEHRAWAALPEGEREKRSKKNFYRVLKSFATRRDLVVDEARRG